MHSTALTEGNELLHTKQQGPSRATSQKKHLNGYIQQTSTISTSSNNNSNSNTNSSTNTSSSINSNSNQVTITQPIIQRRNLNKSLHTNPSTSQPQQSQQQQQQQTQTSQQQQQHIDYVGVYGGANNSNAIPDYNKYIQNQQLQVPLHNQQQQQFHQQQMFPLPTHHQGNSHSQQQTSATPSSSQSQIANLTQIYSGVNTKGLKRRTVVIPSYSSLGHRLQTDSGIATSTTSNPIGGNIDEDFRSNKAVSPPTATSPTPHLLVNPSNLNSDSKSKQHQHNLSQQIQHSHQPPHHILSKRNSTVHRKVHSSIDNERRTTTNTSTVSNNSSKLYSKQSDHLPLSTLLNSIEETIPTSQPTTNASSSIRSNANQQLFSSQQQNQKQKVSLYSNVHENSFLNKANLRRATHDRIVSTLNTLNDDDEVPFQHEFSQITQMSQFSAVSLSPNRSHKQAKFNMNQQQNYTKNTSSAIPKHTSFDGNIFANNASSSNNNNNTNTALNMNQQQQIQQAQQNIINNIQKIALKSQLGQQGSMLPITATSSNGNQMSSVISSALNSRPDVRKQAISQHTSKGSNGFSRSIIQSQQQTRANSPSLKPTSVVPSQNAGGVKLKAKIKVQKNNFLTKQQSHVTSVKNTEETRNLTQLASANINVQQQQHMSGKKRHNISTLLPEVTDDAHNNKQRANTSLRNHHQQLIYTHQQQHAQLPQSTGHSNRLQTDHGHYIDSDYFDSLPQNKQRQSRGLVSQSPSDRKSTLPQERTRQASHDHVFLQKKRNSGSTPSSFLQEYYPSQVHQKHSAGGAGRNESGTSTPIGQERRSLQSVKASPQIGNSNNNEKGVVAASSSNVHHQQGQIMQNARQIRSTPQKREEQFEDVHEVEGEDIEDEVIESNHTIESDLIESQTKISQDKSKISTLNSNKPKKAIASAAIALAAPAEETEDKQSEAVVVQPVKNPNVWDLSEEEWKNFGDRFPKTLNKQKLLGRGGFALVWLGENKTTKELYAVKQIQSRNAHQTHIKEIWFGSFFYKNGIPKDKHLSYRGINNLSKMMLYDIQTIDTWIYYELCGQSLGSSLYELKGEGYRGEDRIYRVHYKKLYTAIKRDLKEFKKLVFELAHALWLLSDNRIVHSDLKTENILVTMKETPGSNGVDGIATIDQVKLIDYGSSFTFGNLKHFSMATPEYMAPEILNFILYQNQLRHLPELLEYLKNYQKTYVIDIWSLGCVMMEIISGIPLWMSLKTIVTHKGQECIRHGLFAAKGRVFENIIEKQIDVVSNLDECIDHHNYSGVVIDDDLRYLVKRMLVLDPSQRISPKEVCQFLHKKVLGTEFVDISPPTL